MDDIIDLIKRIGITTSSNIRVCLPARINSYDYKTQKASVKIDLKEQYSNDFSVDYPVISGVPVVFPASGGASITMPVNQGEPCMLIFADRDISNWLIGGTDQNVSSNRMHTLTDAIALVGLKPFNKAGFAENNTDMLIAFSGSKVRLKPNGIIEIETVTQINCKTENVLINCTAAKVIAKDNVKVNCENATLTASNTVKVNSVNVTINNSENINVNSSLINLKANDIVNIKCNNANVNATNAITFNSPNFNHTGNMQIDGNIIITGNSEINGTVEIAGKLNTKAGIENKGGQLVSNGKTFETHTHPYSKAVEGSSPTVVIPSVTGAPN
jgi:phage gp45-like